MAMFFLIVAIITIPIALYGLMLSIVLLIEQEAEKAEMVRKIKEDNDREIYPGRFLTIF